MGLKGLMDTCKCTILLAATFTKPHFNSHKNSVFLHSHKPTIHVGSCRHFQSLQVRFQLCFKLPYKRTPEMESHLPLNLSFKYINFKKQFYVSNRVFFPHIIIHLVTLKHHLHFMLVTELNTVRTTVYSQTLSFFFAFSMFICSWASSHTENHSCERPAPEMETFFIRGTQQWFPPKYIKKHWASVLFSRKF